VLAGRHSGGDVVQDPKGGGTAPALVATSTIAGLAQLRNEAAARSGRGDGEVSSPQVRNGQDGGDM